MNRPTIACAYLGAGFFAASAAAAPPHPFDVPWIGYDTGVYPEALSPWSSEAADFDGDNVMDLATASWGGTAYMSILFGDGEGGYRIPVTYPLLMESLDLVAADFDNDNDIDIVTCDTGRHWEGFSISLYRNDGEGGFTFAGWFSTGENGPSGITAADFNGDNFLDIAVAHDDYIVYGNTMAVLLNSGGTGFGSPTVITLQGGTRAITSGDIDGDLDPDIIVGHETNKFTVVENREGFWLQQPPIPGINAGSITDLPTVHLADIDLDTHLDLFYSNSGTGGYANGATALWRNDGEGGFAAPETLSHNSYTSGAAKVHTADVTGDNWPDIMTATAGAQDWFLFPGDGAGNFLAPREFRAGQSPIDFQTTDMDADGDLDLTVVARDSLEACVYLNPGDGAFVQPPVIAMVDTNISPAFTTNLESVDLNADGDLDLVIGYRSDFENAFGVSVRHNNGNGTFAPPQTYAEFTYAKWIRVRDLDGDTDPDLVWIDSDSRIHIRRNFGDGTFGSRISSHIVSSGDYLDTWDVDSDNDLDIVVACGFEVAILFNDGNAGFTVPMYHTVGDYFAYTGMGDFNLDNMPDLLTESGAQGYPQISNGNGDGTFDPPNTVPTGRDVHAFAAGHIDHDGNLDFAAVYNLDETGLSIRRGRGDGNFFAGTNYHGSYDREDHTSSLKLADVDGDGNLDALTANFGAKDFSYWKGNGDGTYERLVRYGVAESAYDLAFGDYNGDRVGDVAVVTQASLDSWWYPGVIILWGTGASNTVLPGAFDTVFGAYQGGTLQDLYDSDDSYVVIQQRPAFSVLLPLIRLDVDGTANAPTASQITVTLETGTNALPAQPPQKLLLFNYDTNLWELVDERTATLSDSLVEVPISANPGRFIDDGTNAMRMRIDWFDPGNVFSPAWVTRTDQATWTVLP